jgi:cystathionine beta-lyase family protein involved in aluminum resistance
MNQIIKLYDGLVGLDDHVTIYTASGHSFTGYAEEDTNVDTLALRNAAVAHLSQSITHIPKALVVSFTHHIRNS